MPDDPRGNSVKENLVARPGDWPGAHSAPALLEEEPLEGNWYNRTALFEARLRGERVALDDFAEKEAATLSPLTCWEELPADPGR